MENNTVAITPNRWIPDAKVRGYLYKVAYAAGPVLVGYGLLTADQFGLWFVLLGAILGFGGNVLADANKPKEIEGVVVTPEAAAEIGVAESLTIEDMSAEDAAAYREELKKIIARGQH